MLVFQTCLFNFLLQELQMTIVFTATLAVLVLSCFLFLWRLSNVLFQHWTWRRCDNSDRTICVYNMSSSDFANTSKLSVLLIVSINRQVGLFRCWQFLLFLVVSSTSLRSCMFPRFLVSINLCWLFRCWRCLSFFTVSSTSLRFHTFPHMSRFLVSMNLFWWWNTVPHGRSNTSNRAWSCTANAEIGWRAVTSITVPVYRFSWYAHAWCCCSLLFIWRRLENKCSPGMRSRFSSTQ